MSRLEPTCRLCAAGVTRDGAVNARPAHLLWRMLPSGEMERFQVICDSEVERIVGMLTHPAKFSVDYGMLIGVRPLEDGRYSVWTDLARRQQIGAEDIYDDPFAAARAFVRMRRDFRLGVDFETGAAK